jgi:hypothetical protein
MDWDLATKIAGSVAAAFAIPTFFWTNLRKDVKRTAIIDLATKRVALWNQILTTVNLATDDNSPERKAEQTKAYKAIRQIQEDAITQLQVVSRGKKVSRAATWKAFKFERGKIKTWPLVILWWNYVIATVALLFLAISAFVRIEYAIFSERQIDNLHWLIAVTIVLGLFVLAKFFIYQAESLKHDDPLMPVIDTI